MQRRIPAAALAAIAVKCSATILNYMHLKVCLLLGGRHASVNGLGPADRSGCSTVDLSLMERVLLRSDFGVYFHAIDCPRDRVV